ncbi:hypothetical protein LWI28_005892 [Acer negundo]|uniref:Uncharacterized protein n=1 Tax=Acer negundo TaxID=4023 RepID=A0AAD5I583_ACENE|nr:hypothetical protein LWI28_005892 [Acer negundo]
MEVKGVVLEGFAWQYLDKFFTGYYLSDSAASEVSKDYRKLVAKISKMGLCKKKRHCVLYAFSFMIILFALSVYGVLCSDNFCVHVLFVLRRKAQYAAEAEEEDENPYIIVYKLRLVLLKNCRGCMKIQSLLKDQWT